jgi:FdhD protein
VKLEIRQILRLKREGSYKKPENLPIEKEYQILVNGDFVSTVTLTPSQEREFLVGHLYSNGVIEKADQIRDFTIVGQRFLVEADLSSGEPYSGGDKKEEPDWTVAASSIRDNLNSALDSELYLKTGGTHTSALCREDSTLTSAEDVGRLNTLDKIFGWGLLQKVDMKCCYAVTSGRITSHTVRKAARAKVPLLASKGAVTSLAVDLAQKWGLTLVGFVREERMSVYTLSDRIRR